MDQALARTGSDPPAEDTTFFTLVGTAQEERHARLLIESLRSYGGPLSHCPFWVYRDEGSADPAGRSGTYDHLGGVHAFALDTREAVRYYFAAKVRAYSAEARLSARILAVMPLIFVALVLAANPQVYSDALRDPLVLPGLLGAGALQVVGILSPV